MKRFACFALIVSIGMLLGAAYAQEGKELEKKEGEHAAGQAPGKESATEAKEGEHGGASEGHAKEGEEGNMEPWKWANFLVLAGGFGYLIGKNAGPFFDGRTAQIRKDMVEAAAARQDAEARAAEVQRRLDNLETEIAALRAEANRQGEAEAQRLTQQTAAEVAKIQAHAEQEIVAAGKAARLELKRYSAGLAIGLAEQKIRARITSSTEDDLVRSFVDNLK
jgi:F-type H+-transporting ATPase subunit b